MATEKTRNQIKEKLLESLSAPETGGSITHACKAVGCSRQAVSEWRKNDPVFRANVMKAILEGKEELAGLAERALVERLKNADTTAIIFTLKSLRRDVYGSSNEIQKISDYSEENGPPLGLKQVKTFKQSLLLLKILLSHCSYSMSQAPQLSESDKSKMAETVLKMQSCLGL